MSAGFGCQNDRTDVPHLFYVDEIIKLLIVDCFFGRREGEGDIFLSGGVFDSIIGAGARPQSVAVARPMARP